jgi:hypothetical protein
MMRKLIRLTMVVAAVGATVAAPTGSAVAAADSAVSGQHVAMCAREHLGKRANPRTVTCTMPDGSTMIFPNFGAMVQHMRAMESA